MSEPHKNNKKELVKALIFKTLIIFIIGALYTAIFADTSHKNSILDYDSSFKSSNGICVFDIDATLNCEGAYAAVTACKNAGFELAINTARNKSDAYKIVTNGSLLAKGFSYDFVETAKNQDGLNGPFQYRESWGFSQPEEQKYHSKSYGMRKIAEYYRYKTDDIDSRKIVIFDDMLHNIVQMQPNILEAYRKQRCKLDDNGLCYNKPGNSPKSVEFPRNWKIYRSKWVGHFCMRWNDPAKAAQDAYEAMNDVLTDKPRQFYTKSIVENN